MASERVAMGVGAALALYAADAAAGSSGSGRSSSVGKSFARCLSACGRLLVQLNSQRCECLCVLYVYGAHALA